MVMDLKYEVSVPVSSFPHKEQKINFIPEIYFFSLVSLGGYPISVISAVSAPTTWKGGKRSREEEEELLLSAPPPPESPRQICRATAPHCLATDAEGRR